jgi:hypothetical protein
MRRTTPALSPVEGIVILGSLTILASIAWGAVIWQEPHRLPTDTAQIHAQPVLDLAWPSFRSSSRKCIETFQVQDPANCVSTLPVVAPGYTAMEQEIPPTTSEMPPSIWTSPCPSNTWSPHGCSSMPARRLVDW